VSTKAWYQSNRARILAEKKEYYSARREELKQKARDYRERNAEKVREQERERGARRRKDGSSTQLQRQRAKEWYYRNRDYVLERSRETRLVKTYCMTLEQYDARLAAQHERCAICQRHESEFADRLVVDHCHGTGVVRGLLCDDCNMALGRLGDTAEALGRAFQYLARFEDTLVKSA
jgi:hypothetical protein